MRVSRRMLRGISMVEVLAAMVIFSTGAVLLFSWIGQANDRLGRLAEEQRVLFAELTALEFLKTLNPMLAPVGEAELADGVKLHWSSRQLGDGETVRRPGSLYEIGLYQVKVSVEVPRHAVRESSVQIAGWRQVKDKSSQAPIMGGG